MPNGLRSQYPLSLFAMLFLATSYSLSHAQLGGVIGEFPEVAFPAGNPTSPEKVQLGKALFFDEQLSTDNTMACATCHFPEAGGADLHAGARGPGLDGILGTLDDSFGSPGMVLQDRDGNFLSDEVSGVGRQATTRTAPTVIGAAFFESLFWDMSAGPVFRDQGGAVVLAAGAALESQAVGPPLSSVEMAHLSNDWDSITAKLETVRPLDLASDLPPDLDEFLHGVQSYAPLFEAAFGSSEITRERVAMAIATYERTLVPDQTPFDLGTMTPSQQRGLAIFFARSNCTVCHQMNGLFSDGRAHTINLPGHFEFVKTPTLKNVGLRRRLMHSGQFTSLSEALVHYEANFPFFPPLEDQDRSDLIDFLANGLTDPRVAKALPPFDRPTLHSELVPHGTNQFGSGSPGTGDIEPQLISASPPNLGHTDFTIGIGRGLGAALAALVISRAPLLGGTLVQGIPVHVRLDQADVVLLMLAGEGPGEGVATYRESLPTDAAALGLDRYVQAFVLDPQAEGGFASTRAAAYALFSNRLSSSRL